MMFRRAANSTSTVSTATRGYRCVVVSSRIFVNDPKVKPALETNLKELHDALQGFDGFLGTSRYSLSKWNLPLRERHLDVDMLPNSVTVSHWRGEVDWEQWYTSPRRLAIVKQLEGYLIEPEKHLVLSKLDEQAFLL